MSESFESFPQPIHLKKLINSGTKQVHLLWLSHWISVTVMPGSPFTPIQRSLSFKF